MNISRYKITGTRSIKLADFDTQENGNGDSSDDLKEKTATNVRELTELQSKLYAEGKTALLIIIQAMDAGGKDGAIKHVMSGIDPQGVDVYSFKRPTAEELAHDYLWRAAKALPVRGTIAVFNRSYYEDVLIAKVHKLYEDQNIPDRCKGPNTIKKRLEQIRHFEEYMWENGIVTAKFFLHISKETQRKRFLDRIEEKDKNWKFSEEDVVERAYWDDYMEAYQSAINATATAENPWYIIPGDKKPYTRAVISEILLDVMRKIDPQYPEISKDQAAVLAACERKLNEEK